MLGEGCISSAENARFKVLNRIANYKLKIHPTTGCWIKGDNIDNYPNGKFFGEVIKLHIISAILFHGLELNKGQCSLHKCDVPACCNPSHLYVGTDHDNAKDRKYRRKNNIPKGKVINRVETPNKEFELEFLPTNDHKVN